MSIFGNIFGNGNGGIAHSSGGSAQLPPAPAPQVGEQQTAAPAPTAAPAQQQSSPLDSLKAFWDTPVDAEGKPVAAPADLTATDIFNFDPAKVTESAGKLNFTANVDPELVSKALGGDQQAFMDVINKATQNAFAAATLNTGKLINQGHVTNNSRFSSTLPTQIRKVQLEQTETTNPILQHAAAQPLVAALKSMAFAKNPNANPVDVTKQVEALMVGLGTAIADATPESTQRKEAAKAGEADWSNYLES